MSCSVQCMPTVRQAYCCADLSTLLQRQSTAELPRERAMSPEPQLPPQRRVRAVAYVPVETLKAR